MLPLGLQLKDATPANILFRGAQPVFVDLPSIVAREPGSCLWNARHQFETTFLLPLIASVETGLPIATTLPIPSPACRMRRWRASSACVPLAEAAPVADGRAAGGLGAARGGGKPAAAVR